MNLRRLCLLALTALSLLIAPLAATQPAAAADAVGTTVVLVAPAEGSSTYVGHEVTFQAKVTAADGSVPQGVVAWDDAGACMTRTAEGRPDADGNVTLKHTFDRAYDSYSLNVCFFPDDSDRYQSSEDFNCCLNVQTIPTTTTLVAPQPPASARTGQPVTFKAKVTAADGSVPQGVVAWDDAGACMSEVAEARVGPDGIATMTFTEDRAYDSYSLNACFRPDNSEVYQSSEDFSCCLDVGPTATTVALVAPAEGTSTYVGHEVTFKAKVTAADGSVPQGVVAWDDAGACMSEVAEARVGPDGIATMTFTEDRAYDSYSLNACFRPDNSDVYQYSEDFNCCLKVQTIPTTTTLVAPQPPAYARPGQPVTFKAKVTAADGSVPQGVVAWDDAGACMSEVAEARVGPDGIATMTFTEDRPYDTYSLNACFRPDNSEVYQSSEDFSCCLDVGDVPTTTTISSVAPQGGARTGQPVTMTVTMTAADGSVPAGRVTWQRNGCTSGPGSDDVSAPVGANGKATVTRSFAATGSQYQLAACFTPTDATQYQASQDNDGYYTVSAATKPVVTRQPTPVVVVAGQLVTLSADASGAPAPTVKWQRSTSAGKTWTDMPGKTGKTLSFTAIATDNGSLFRAVFSNSAGSATTSSASALVTESFLGYVSPPLGAKLKPGTTGVVSFRLGGPTGSAFSDAAAKSVPTLVRVLSSKSVVVASSACPYNASYHQYRCGFSVPASTAAGNYQVLTLTRLGPGTWVPAIAVGSTHNPQTVTVAK